MVTKVISNSKTKQASQLATIIRAVLVLLTMHTEHIKGEVVLQNQRKRASNNPLKLLKTSTITILSSIIPLLKSRTHRCSEVTLFKHNSTMLPLNSNKNQAVKTTHTIICKALLLSKKTILWWAETIWVVPSRQTWWGDASLIKIKAVPIWMEAKYQDNQIKLPIVIKMNQTQ